MQAKVLSSAPGIPSLYLRALLPKKSQGKASSLPQKSLQLKSVTADPTKVKRYAAVCGFSSGNHLPVTYPHMLAFPLHMELMLSKDFPFALMGLVHISNSITQHRPIRIDEAMTITCRFGELRDHDKGKVIEMVTEVRVGDVLAWESRSDMLARVKVEKRVAKQAKPVKALENVTGSWKLASNLGRRYALVSGDSNPIHLTALSAKVFGFKRHIAHGMWTKAHALAVLESDLPDAYTVTVDFKLPVFLPAEVNFYTHVTKTKTVFEIRDSKGKKPHLRGEIKALK